MSSEEEREESVEDEMEELSSEGEEVERKRKRGNKMKKEEPTPSKRKRSQEAKVEVEDCTALYKLKIGSFVVTQKSGGVKFNSQNGLEILLTNPLKDKRNFKISLSDTQVRAAFVRDVSKPLQEFPQAKKMVTLVLFGPWRTYAWQAVPGTQSKNKGETRKN